MLPDGTNRASRQRTDGKLDLTRGQVGFLKGAVTRLNGVSPFSSVTKRRTAVLWLASVIDRCGAVAGCWYWWRGCTTYVRQRANYALKTTVQQRAAKMNGGEIAW